MITKRNFLLVFVLTWLFYTPILAQNTISIFGKVLENNTNSPVVFATVAILDNNSKKAITGAITKEDGSFSLTTEASNFYISVQKFQTTLGRHVGTPYVSDPDAIAFLMAAGITDGTQAAAINTLVIRMKADGIWTKMKAIYPFVGGSAASHKWNLKDPRDLDAAYRLVG